MELEESAHEYAQKQLAEGKKPKNVIQALIDVGYEAKEAKQAVKHARKKTHHTIAAIGIVLALAVVVLIAYTATPPAPTMNSQQLPASANMSLQECERLDQPAREQCVQDVLGEPGVRTAPQAPALPGANLSASELQAAALAQNNERYCLRLQEPAREQCVRDVLGDPGVAAAPAATQPPGEGLNDTQLYQRAIEEDNERYCERLPAPQDEQCVQDVLGEPPSHG